MSVKTPVLQETLLCAGLYWLPTLQSAWIQAPVLSLSDFVLTDHVNRSPVLAATLLPHRGTGNSFPRGPPLCLVRHMARPSFRLPSEGGHIACEES